MSRAAVRRTRAGANALARMYERLSVVVPTRDEVANLPRFLAALPAGPELLLADASSDGTGDLALALRPARTRVIRVEGSIALARQRAAAIAAGDLLLFADADVAFAPDYFPRLATQLQRGAPGGGPWDALYGPKLSRDAYRRYYALVAWSQRLGHRLLGVAGASGSNMLVRADVLHRTGGFRPELVCNEDSELLFRLARLGYRVGFAPELAVYAYDHRRLRRGLVGKSLHSLGRNALLFLTCSRPRLPRLLDGDWGYWSHRRVQAPASAEKDARFR